MKTIHTTEVFDDWFAGLRDRHAAARIKMRIRCAEEGNFGDCEPMGEGVSEMRIHYGPGRNPLLNSLPRGEETTALSPTGGKLDRGLTCTSRNAAWKWRLLAGGDKSTQARDIKTALKLAHEL